MRHRRLSGLVEGTADAAFAVDDRGLVVAWNASCEALFGIPATRALGQPCGSVLQCRDECGPVRGAQCSVLAAVGRRRPIGNFDLVVETRTGSRWCNVSVLLAEQARSVAPCSVHIVRDIHLRKRLELLMRDFVVSATSLSPEAAVQVAASGRSPSRVVDLTKQESAVLRLLARGATTAGIASEQGTSRATVSNHVQHLMRKLGAHTRLEAIRRAERAGLL